MNINSAALVFFSPTGTTKKILNAIAKGLGVNDIRLIDLTSLTTRNSETPQIEEDVVIIGSPVYKHRIPKMLYSYLANLKGNKKPVVLVTVYGNIEEGIALDELHSITEKAGFKVIAAGSFIGEHSFSTDEVPIAKGRPTDEDLKKVEEFGRSIKEKLYKIDNSNYTSLDIPKSALSLFGRILPENVTRMLAKTPAADINKCNHCGACVKLCPMSAIDKDTLEIDENQCLRCFGCVKTCSEKARKIVYKKKLLVTRFFTLKSKVKHEPKIYL